MKIKNLFLISLFCLLSFNSFASTAKRVTEMDQRKFIDSAFIYKKYNTSNDPKMKKLSKYSADLFAQYFALACKIKGIWIPTLEVVYQKASDELIQKGECEARAQGITIPDISKKK